MKAGKPPPKKGLPFALVETGAKDLRLVAVNAMARNFGLGIGQRLADARAAVPDLLSELHEPELDLASLLGLCRWMERYSPWVSPDAPDGILLDATGIPHLFGGEAQMVAEISRRLAQYDYTARIAMAGTIGAAWALARYASHDDELKKLPIEALRIDGDAARTLRRLGLKTIGSLLAIPRAALARRFRGEMIPENVLIRLDQAMGRRDEPLNPLTPSASFIAHQAFMEPVITSEGMDLILTRLVGRIVCDLEKKSQGVTRLNLKLFRTDGSRLVLSASLSTPSHEPAHLLRLLRPKLETIDAGFGIDAMTLEARETAAAIVQQYGFMESGNPLGLEQLNDRVMNRHGAGISTLQTVESHIPERAETFKPQDSFPRHGRARPGHPLAAIPEEDGRDMHGHDEGTGKSRPLLIFNRPEPATVIATVPDGPPMRFIWRRVTHRVMRAQGPERIAPEWWRLDKDEGLTRDYYVIEDDHGRRYWFYREGLYGETQPKWFIHGLSP